MPTFHAAGRPFVNFRQLSEQLGDPLTTSVNFLCCRENFHQLPSTFHAARGTSINFCQLYMQPGELPSNFHAAGRPSVSCRQLSVRPVELPSNSVKFLCHLETFRQLPSTFMQQEVLPSTLRAIGRPSVNCGQYTMWLADPRSTCISILCGREIFRQILSTFRMISRPSSISVNLPCCRETFRHSPSTFLCDR